MNTVIFCLYSRVKKEITEALEYFKEQDNFDDNWSFRYKKPTIKKIGKYFAINFEIETCYWKHEGIEEWLFAVMEYAELHPRVKYEYIYYGDYQYDNKYINSDKSGNFFSTRYVIQLDRGRCGWFGDTVEYFNGRLQDILKEAKVKLDIIPAFPNMQALSMFLKEYDIEVIEFADHYKYSQEEYEQWKIKKNTVIEEEEYWGEYYSAYDVREKFNEMISVLHFMKADDRYEDCINEVNKCLEIVEIIQEEIEDV